MWSQRKTTVLENASLIRQNASTSYSSSVAGSLCTLYSRGCVPLNWSPRSLAVVAILGPPPPCCPGQTWPHPPTCLGPSNLSPGSPVLDPLHRFGPSPPPPPHPIIWIVDPSQGFGPIRPILDPLQGFWPLLDPPISRSAIRSAFRSATSCGNCADFSGSLLRKLCLFQKVWW